VPQVIARELLKDEQAHVTFLREALGNDSVPIPQIDM
jgi:hypothetical protein